MLRKVCICQSTTCQNKGAKALMHRLTALYQEQYTAEYPDLRILPADCMGDCEQGPIVKVNDSILLREVDHQKAQQLLADPQSLLGQVMHVLEQDRATFERIINGELY